MGESGEKGVRRAPRDLTFSVLPLTPDPPSALSATTHHTTQEATVAQQKEMDMDEMVVQEAHLGDGAYFSVTGSREDPTGFIITANHHDPEMATDTVHFNSDAERSLRRILNNREKQRTAPASTVGPSGIEWAPWGVSELEWPFAEGMRLAFDRQVTLKGGRVSVAAIRPAGSGSTWFINTCRPGTMEQFNLEGDAAGGKYEVKFGRATPEYMAALPEFDGW